MSATLKMLPAALAAAEREPARRLPEDLVVPTRIARLDGLQKALDGAGIKHRYLEEALYAETVEGVLFAFVRNGSRFDAHFAHDSDEAWCEHTIELVEHEYGKEVQRQV